MDYALMVNQAKENMRASRAKQQQLYTQMMEGIDIKIRNFNALLIVYIYFFALTIYH